MARHGFDRHGREARREAIETTLARAALCRLLAQAFAYPVPGHAREMARGFARLNRAALAQTFPPATIRLVDRAAAAWRRPDDATIALDYTRHFLASAPVSLHETAYGDGRRMAGQPVELADINGFYVAFGFTSAEANPELPDHVASELEFYSLLLIKEAYARARGWSAKTRVTRTASKDFLAWHLGRWMGALSARLVEQVSAGPHPPSAAALEAVVAHECRRRRVTVRPVSDRKSNDVMQQDAFTCPRATPDARGDRAWLPQTETAIPPV